MSIFEQVNKILIVEFQIGGTNVYKAQWDTNSWGKAPGRRFKSGQSIKQRTVKIPKQFWEKYHHVPQFLTAWFWTEREKKIPFRQILAEFDVFDWFVVGFLVLKATLNVQCIDSFDRHNSELN